MKALDIRTRCFGTGHASVADTKYNMARVYLRQAATGQARQLFGEAAAIYRNALGAAHSKALDSLRQAEEVALDQTRKADSEAVSEQLQAQEATLPREATLLLPEAVSELRQAPAQEATPQHEATLPLPEAGSKLRQAQEATPPHEAGMELEADYDDAPGLRLACGSCIVA